MLRQFIEINENNFKVRLIVRGFQQQEFIENNSSQNAKFCYY